MAEIYYRNANAEDISLIQTFLLDHGPNEWNYLPAPAVLEHVSQIANGSVRAYVALRPDHQLIGVMTFETGLFYPQYEPHPPGNQGYIAEGVVHQEYVGRGIGLQLLILCTTYLVEAGISNIYAKRHEENPFSRSLLQKAGFKEIDTFYDPLIRPHGSRRTTVCHLKV
jgi:RimJ/RimL family protein N-acetyltransferase